MDTRSSSNAGAAATAVANGTSGPFKIGDHVKVTTPAGECCLAKIVGTVKFTKCEEDEEGSGNWRYFVDDKKSKSTGFLTKHAVEKGEDGVIHFQDGKSPFYPVDKIVPLGEGEEVEMAKKLAVRKKQSASAAGGKKHAKKRKVDEPASEDGVGGEQQQKEGKKKRPKNKSKDGVGGKQQQPQKRKKKAPTRKMIRHLNAREREKALNEALKDVSSEDSDESTDDEVVRDEVGKNVKGGGEQSSSEEEEDDVDDDVRKSGKGGGQGKGLKEHRGAGGGRPVLPTGKSAELSSSSGEEEDWITISKYHRNVIHAECIRDTRVEVYNDITPGETVRATFIRMSRSVADSVWVYVGTDVGDTSKWIEVSVYNVYIGECQHCGCKLGLSEADDTDDLFSCWSCPQAQCAACMVKHDAEQAQRNDYFLTDSDGVHFQCVDCVRAATRQKQQSPPRNFRRISREEFMIGHSAVDGDDGGCSEEGRNDVNGGGGDANDNKEEDGGDDEEESHIEKVAAEFAGRGLALKLTWRVDKASKTELVIHLLDRIDPQNDHVVGGPIIREDLMASVMQQVRVLRNLDTAKSLKKRPLKDFSVASTELLRLVHTEYCSDKECHCCHPLKESIDGPSEFDIEDPHIQKALELYQMCCVTAEDRKGKSGKKGSGKSGKGNLPDYLFNGKDMPMFVPRNVSCFFSLCAHLYHFLFTITASYCAKV